MSGRRGKSRDDCDIDFVTCDERGRRLPPEQLEMHEAEPELAAIITLHNHIAMHITETLNPYRTKTGRVRTAASNDVRLQFLTEAHARTEWDLAVRLAHRPGWWLSNLCVIRVLTDAFGAPRAVQFFRRACPYPHTCGGH